MSILLPKTDLSDTLKSVKQVEIKAQLQNAKSQQSIKDQQTTISSDISQTQISPTQSDINSAQTKLSTNTSQSQTELSSTNGNWIAWIHEGYKIYNIDYTKLAKEFVVDLEMEWSGVLSEMKNCCRICVVLNSNHFLEEKMPKNKVYEQYGTVETAGLLHPNCHCYKMPINKPIPKSTVFAYAPIAKFVGYLWADKYADNGKRKMFWDWGYTIDDSEMLQAEYERQAVEKYSNGDYTIGKLDEYGQRISIKITIHNYDFIAGWTVRPNGIITMNTPFGAK